MPNEDYIKRSEAVARLTGKACCVNSPGKVRAFATAINVIETMPAADVEPKRKPGRWVSKEGIYGVVYCSICDFELKIDNTPRCPNCGAKMDKEADNGDKL